MVPAGSSGTLTLDVTPKGLAASASDRTQIIVNYLRCRGAVELGLCATEGYGVES